MTNLLEERGLFVREASGLIKEIGPWSAIFFGLLNTDWGGFVWPAQIPTIMYPGANVLLMRSIGFFFSLQMGFTFFFLNVAMPRSGGAYVATSRGYHPFWGIAEGWRSVIQNPLFVATGSFFGVQGFGSALKTAGIIAGVPSLISTGSVLLTNMPIQIGLSLTCLLFGVLSDALGPGFFKRLTTIGAIVALFMYGLGWLYSFSVPLKNLPARWDETWGAGAYDEIVATAAANGWQPIKKYSWEASWNSILMTGSAGGNASNIMAVAGEVSQPRLSFALAHIGVVLVGSVFTFAHSIPLYTKFFPFVQQYVFLWHNKIPLTINQSPMLPPYLPVFWGSLMRRNALLITLYGSTEFVKSYFSAVGSIYWISRPAFAMAFDRFFPETFSKIHPRFHTPINALYLSTMLGIFWTFFTALTPWSAILTQGALTMFIQLNLNLACFLFPYFKREVWEMGLTTTVFGLPAAALNGAIGTCWHTYRMILGFRGITMTACLVTAGYQIIAVIGMIYYLEKAKKRGADPARIFGMLPPA